MANDLRYSPSLLLVARESLIGRLCDISLPKVISLSFPKHKQNQYSHSQQHHPQDQPQQDQPQQPTIEQPKQDQPQQDFYSRSLLLALRKALVLSAGEASLPKTIVLDFATTWGDDKQSDNDEASNEAMSARPLAESKNAQVDVDCQDVKLSKDRVVESQTQQSIERECGALSCAYESCKWIGPVSEYGNHISQCPCRPVGCPHAGCTWRGPSFSLSSHQSRCAPRIASTSKKVDSICPSEGKGTDRSNREMWKNARTRDSGFRSHVISASIPTPQTVRRRRRDFRQQGPLNQASNVIRVDCGPTYRLIPLVCTDDVSGGSQKSMASRIATELQPNIPEELALEWALASSIDDPADVKASNDDMCAICLERLCPKSLSFVELPCRHAFHLNCLATMQMPESAQQGTCDATCAICRTPFALAAMRPQTRLTSNAEVQHTRSTLPSEVQLSSNSSSKAPSESLSFDLDEQLIQQMEARVDAEIGADAHNAETFGETNGWSFKENITANLRNEDSRLGESSKSSSSDILIKEPVHVLPTVPQKDIGSKWRRAGRHRVKLIQDIFSACSPSKSGHLGALEMRKFAALSGFDGSVDDWAEEYKMLCEDRRCEPTKGFGCQEFIELVNDASENGCYCTDIELQTIHEKLTKVI